MRLGKIASSLALIAAVALAPLATASAGGYGVVYSFKGYTVGDGGEPTFAGLIDIGGLLYGTTRTGGAYSNNTGKGGTVFVVNPATGTESVLHSFGNGQDGFSPYDSLLDVGGVLYGTTYSGGANQIPPNLGGGTVFSLNLSTGVETVSHSFGGAGDGANPAAPLLDLRGTLYGTTSGGDQAGDSILGTVFSIKPGSGAEVVIHAFDKNNVAKNGGTPQSGLIAAGNILYGTTFLGGPKQRGADGVLFAVNATTGAERVLHAFGGGGADGCEPYSGVVELAGVLYGVTSLGGANNPNPHRCGPGGTVFSYDLTTRAYKLLHSFGGAGDGLNVEGDLIAVNGALYGTTSQGGASLLGCVFKIDLASGVESVVHSFKGYPAGDGSNPTGPLIDVGGVLYGTTSSGGANGWGTVYALTP